MNFAAPVRDLRFSLFEAAGLQELLDGSAYAEVDQEVVGAVLEGAGEFAAGVLAPLNREGDRVGAWLENGQVIAAPGFADA